MDRFIGGFVGGDGKCLVYDRTGHNRIHGLFHQLKDEELQLIMSELNSPSFSAWKVACSAAGISAGKFCVITKAGRGSIYMIHHSIGPFV